MKIERTRIHFLSNIFAAIAVLRSKGLFLKLPINGT